MASQKTAVLSIDNPEARARAAAALRGGALVGVPTDTVYGVASAFDRADGIAALYNIKGRDIEKAIPVLLAHLSQLDLVAIDVPDAAGRLIEAFWPGPLTLVLAKRPSVLEALAPGRETIGVRLPAHRQLREWIEECGTPLACTSANRSGLPPALTAAAVADTFPAGLHAVLDGGRAPAGVASSVVDLSDPSRPRLPREAALSRERLETVLGMSLG